MMNRTKTFVNSLWKSLWGRLLIIIISMVFPFNLFNFFLARNMTELMQSRSLRMEERILASEESSLETRMHNARNLQASLVASNADCIRMLEAKTKDYRYQNAAMKFRAAMKAMTQMTDGADGYFYLMPDQDDAFLISASTGSSSVLNDLRKVLLENPSEGTENAQKTPGSDVRIMDLSVGKCIVFFSSYRHSYYGNYIVLDPVTSKLQKELLQGYISLNWYLRSDTEEEMPKGLCRVMAEGRILRVVGILPKRIAIQGFRFYRAMVLFLTVFSFSIIPVLYLLLRRETVVPLERINHAHHEIQYGNPDYRITGQRGTKEYEEAYHSFNQMADSLKNYRISLYEKELENQKLVLQKKDIELMNLQLQIRPHFLLNAFNLMYNLAGTGSREALREVILYLSEYFRYMFRNGSSLAMFNKEIRLIRQYLKMVNLQYGDQIHAEFDFDPELEFLRVPPLLLHNIVENSIKHGASRNRELNILVNGSYEDGYVTLQISDDGPGMSEEILQKNREILCGRRIPDNEYAHLGLYNAYRRMKYYYGEEATMTLDEEKNVYTAVTIRFPYKLDADDDLKGNDNALQKQTDAEATL